MKHAILLLSLTLVVTRVAFSQEDADGCKDHPFFTRLPHFFISACSENYREVEFRTAMEKTVMQEGNATKISYYFSHESATPPSPFQLFKNYENAIVKNGGRRVYFSTGTGGDPWQIATFRFAAHDKEYWVTIENVTPGNPDMADGYDLIVLEKEAMKQEIEASQMFETLNTSGRVSLQINFETGKATIKPDSHGIIDQIVKMLSDNPTLRVSIEGHTDNVGKPESNKKLSESRAAAVLNAIAAKGIEKQRLSSKGWGQTKPVDDNATEEGRAMNRRVEIVKQ